MIKVGINGYGTIGKRVAEAVTLQDDMEIVGIVKTKPTYEMRGALDADYPVFASTKSKVSFFEDYGIKVSGVTEDLVDIAIYECEKFYPSFQQVLFEETNPKEAIKFANLEVIGRA